MVDDREDHGAFSLTLDGHDLVRLTWASGVHIDHDIARAAMTAVDQLNGDVRRGLMIVSAGTIDTTRGARQEFSRPCSVARVALLGSSAVDQVVANFVLRLSSPPVPTRFFTSKVAARRWLCDAPPDA